MEPPSHPSTIISVSQHARLCCVMFLLIPAPRCMDCIHGLLPQPAGEWCACRCFALKRDLVCGLCLTAFWTYAILLLSLDPLQADCMFRTNCSFVSVDGSMFEPASSEWIVWCFFVYLIMMALDSPNLPGRLKILKEGKHNFNGLNNRVPR